MYGKSLLLLVTQANGGGAGGGEGGMGGEGGSIGGKGLGGAGESGVEERGVRVHEGGALGGREEV